MRIFICYRLIGGNVQNIVKHMFEDQLNVRGIATGGTGVNKIESAETYAGGLLNT